MGAKSSHPSAKAQGPFTAGHVATFVDSTGLLQDGGAPSGGTVTTTGSPASGNLTKFGGATSVTNADLTGDVTTAGTVATTIANNAVTYAKMQDVAAASRLLGRGDSGSGDPQELTAGTSLEIVGTALNVKGVWVPSTSSVTGAQNDLDLGTLRNAYVEWSGGAEATITGIKTGVSGSALVVRNTGARVAHFSHQSSSSSSANRLTNNITSSTTPIAPGGWVYYIHNGTNWIMVGHDQGANITPVFSAGDWTGSASMTVTVASGDVLTDAYRVVGKTLHYWFFLNTVTIGGTPSSAILRTAPNSYTFTTSGTGSGGPMRVYDNGTYRTGFAFVYTPSSSTQILFTIQDLSNYAASANNSGLFGYITFEVD